MNKKYIIIIIVAVAVAAAAVTINLWWNSYYHSVDAGDVPMTTIKVAEQRVLPASAEIVVPLLGSVQEKYPSAADALRPALRGMLEKPLSCVPDANGSWKTAPEADGDEAGVRGAGTELGLIGAAPFALVIDLPDSMDWTVSLAYANAPGEETPVYAGGGMALNAGKPESGGFSDTVTVQRSGEYVFKAEGTLMKKSPSKPSGTVFYLVSFSLKDPDPVFSVGRTELEQGDILALKLENVPEGIEPELESALGPAVFTIGVPRRGAGSGGSGPDAESITAEGFVNWYAAVPISNARAAGEYGVVVRAGELVYETTVTVNKFDFAFQNMIIDTSVPSVAAAVTGQAIAEYREKLAPLFPLFNGERYWDGVFGWPIEMGPDDFISTEFGEIRVTNGDPNSRRSHVGMDIAASTGTHVFAAGAGIVLIAEFLLNTGNTVVIDHGGGLKSIYYHMDSVDTTKGVFVEQGDLIGRVGTTGYSTGPHLHFEMRIGEQPISPSMLFDPDAGLYSAW